MSNINDVAKESGRKRHDGLRYFNQPEKVAPSTKKRVEDAINLDRLTRFPELTYEGPGKGRGNQIGIDFVSVEKQTD